MSSGSFGSRMLPVTALRISENQLPKQSQWKHNCADDRVGGQGGGRYKISGARLLERGPG